MRVFLISLFGFMFGLSLGGFLIGYGYYRGVHDVRKEAISNKVAHWQISANGDVLFVWKSNEN